MSRNGGQSLLKFMYNADGIRTNKIVDGVNHVYTLNGTQIVSEAWGTNLLIYLYDESGAPIGMQYRTNSYAANVFDTFHFEKNLQGDIIAVYNADGDRIGSYIYDAWGNFTVTVESTNTILESKIVRIFNPFRYRGYYYDTETQLYYLQSRYYNPAWGRFLNEDGYISTGTGLLGYNMYAYCNNNPVMGYDPTGYFEVDIMEDDCPPFQEDGPVYSGTGNAGYVHGKVSRMTNQMVNKIKSWIMEGKDVYFTSKDEATSFIKRGFPKYPQDDSGARSPAGWHVDQHLRGDTREHINIYNKHLGFNAHLYWNSSK